MTVTLQKNGPVTTVILSRPKARNAVDPTVKVYASRLINYNNPQRSRDLRP